LFLAFLKKKFNHETCNQITKLPFAKIGEYLNNKIAQFLQDNGIWRDIIAPYMP